MLRGGKAERLFADHLRKLVLACDAILDIGTPQRFHKELRAYEAWFAGKKYVAAGFRPEMRYGVYNCDADEDIEKLSFTDASFDGVLCIEVLEHVGNPFRAVGELKRVLRPGGHLLVTVPFVHGFHGNDGMSPAHGSFPDYWRFTHQALRHLFAELADLEVCPLDGPVEVILRQMHVGRWLWVPPLRRLVDAADRPRIGRATSRHLLYAIK